MLSTRGIMLAWEPGAGILSEGFRGRPWATRRCRPDCLDSFVIRATVSEAEPCCES
jgi:hypothetical protein